MTPKWTPEWIMAVSAVAYVIATISIMISNIRMAKATSRQVDELQRQFKEQNRPYISIQFQEVRSGMLCLAIENTGNSPAHDMHIVISEAFIDNVPDSKSREGLRRLAQCAMYLSPGQRMYWEIAGPSDFEAIKAEPLIADMAYTGGGCKYLEHVEINVDAYGSALVYSSPLEDISSWVQRISENLGEISAKLH